MKKSYDLFIEPTVHQDRKKLPGHIRQRIKRLISQLATEPRPHNSLLLDTQDLILPNATEVRRIRLDKW